MRFGDAAEWIIDKFSTSVIWRNNTASRTQNSGLVLREGAIFTIAARWCDIVAEKFGLKHFNTSLSYGGDFAEYAKKQFESDRCRHTDTL